MTFPDDEPSPQTPHQDIPSHPPPTYNTAVGPSATPNPHHTTTSAFVGSQLTNIRKGIGKGLADLGKKLNN